MVVAGGSPVGLVARVRALIANLMILMGHGVCLDPKNAREPTAWRGYPASAAKYVQQLEVAIRAAAADPLSTLVFTGGCTVEEAGEVSEAMSLWRIAEACRWFGHPKVASWVLREEFARDSLENVLFALCVFYLEYGRWPSTVSLYGLGFKAERFELHRQGLRFPASRWNYVQVCDPDPPVLDRARAGEARKLEAVRADLLLTGPEWQAQRALRDPFGRGHPYAELVPDLRELFEYLARHELPRRFPWANAVPPHAG